jgi:Carboxypeptidase regulatory-like domain
MRRKFVFAVLALLLPYGPAHAQSGYVGARAYDPNSPTHTVSGSVVDSATGEPIPCALVQLMGPLPRSDLTDSQGSFRFEGVPEGRAMFMARKPGFFSSEELSRGGGRPRAPMTITGDVSSLVLKLTPEGTVAGTITGDDGEPLEGVRLRLKRQVISNGRKQWETRGQSTTNDNGEFRAADLIPGTYYLMAQAQRPTTPHFAHLKPGAYYLAVSARPWMCA